MIWALGKIIIDCGRDSCTTGSYQDPVTVVGIPWWGTGWALVVGGILVLIFIIATAFVRYRRQERLQAESQSADEVEIAKANRKTAACPTCGTVYVPDVPAGKK